MAKNTQPVLKRCKALGLSPAVMGYSFTDEEVKYRNPKPQMRRKQSEYGKQLMEKQKVKFIYGVLEKQFHHYYEMAERKRGVTGEILLQYLERRLDNVVFRMGFAGTRREARQLVNHGHFLVNGKRCNIPSALVKTGDVIAVSPKFQESKKFKGFKSEEESKNVVGLLEMYGNQPMPKWIKKEPNAVEGEIIAMPDREDIDYDVSENLIVELYSR